MFINPNDFSQISEIQLDGYLPLVLEDPIDLTWYTLCNIIEFITHETYVGYTNYLPKHLDTVKSYFTDKINLDKANELIAGFNFTVNGITYKFDSNDRALLNITNAAIVANANPLFTTFWITYDNQIVSMSNDDLKNFYMTALQSQTEIILKYGFLKDQVRNCNTVEEILALNLSI